MSKKLYYLLEDNADLSCYVADMQGVVSIIEAETASLKQDDKNEIQFTITPTWMTPEDFEALPDL